MRSGQLSEALDAQMTTVNFVLSCNDRRPHNVTIEQTTTPAYSNRKRVSAHFILRHLHFPTSHFRVRAYRAWQVASYGRYRNGAEQTRAVMSDGGSYGFRELPSRLHSFRPITNGRAANTSSLSFMLHSLRAKGRRLFRCMCMYVIAGCGGATVGGCR